MFISETSRACLIAATLLACSLLLTSCGLRVSKGDVYQVVSKDIRIGMSRPEVNKYVESLKVNGVEADLGEYVPNTSRRDIIAPDGKGVIFEGVMSASFGNGAGGRAYFCEAVFIIFYFDGADRLITYHVDC